MSSCSATSTMFASGRVCFLHPNPSLPYIILTTLTGGKLGAWVGAIQAPMTLGISFIGTGIAARNRVVAKRRLEMIHAELRRRGLGKHAEDWKDSAFAALAVGAGTAVGMGFVPGAEVAAQGFAEAGAMNAAQYASGVATSQVAQNLGSVMTETATAHYTDPDTYFHPHGRCIGTTTTGTPIFETTSQTYQAPPAYGESKMNVGGYPAPVYGQNPAPVYGETKINIGGFPAPAQWQTPAPVYQQPLQQGGYSAYQQQYPQAQPGYPQQFPQQQYPQYGRA